MQVASMAMRMLAVPQLELAMAHTLESNITQWGAMYTQSDELHQLCCGWGGSTTPFATTAIGELLGALAAALRGAATATPLHFSSNPILSAWTVYCGGCVNLTRSYGALLGFALAPAAQVTAGAGSAHSGASSVVVLSASEDALELDVSAVLTPAADDVHGAGAMDQHLCVEQRCMAWPGRGVAQWVTGPGSVRVARYCTPVAAAAMVVEIAPLTLTRIWTTQ
jgi:hypothetical protein